MSRFMANEAMALSPGLPLDLDDLQRPLWWDNRLSIYGPVVTDFLWPRSRGLGLPIEEGLRAGVWWRPYITTRGHSGRRGYTGVARVRLRINNVEYQDNLEEKTWFINTRYGTEIGTARFMLEDPDLTLDIVNNLTLGKEVIVEDFYDVAFRFFGGIVSNVAITPEGVGRRITIDCQDWKKLPERYYVTQRYVSQTDRFIIQDMFTRAGLAEIDTSEVVSTSTIDSINFNALSLRQALDLIQAITGILWDITPFKILRYEPQGVRTPPPPFYQFTDDPDDISDVAYQEPTYRKDIGEYNVVRAKGAQVLSPDIVDIYNTDGTSTRYRVGSQTGTSPIIAAPASNPTRIIIELNSGTDGAPVWVGNEQSVGIEFVDVNGVGGIDVLWNATTGLLIWNVAPPAFATNGFRLTGRYRGPLTVVVEDLESIQALGKRYEKVMDFADSRTEDELRKLATGFLRDYGDRENLTFNFLHDRVEVGHLVRVTNARFGLVDKVLLVHNLDIRLVGATTAQYTATLGRITPSLSRLFEKLRELRTVPVEEDNEGIVTTSGPVGLKVVTGRSRGANPTLQVWIGGGDSNAIYEAFWPNVPEEVATFFLARWLATTFIPAITHYSTGVRLSLSRDGLPGIITVSIRATSGGLPTGGDLRSGTTDGDTLPLFPDPGVEREILWTAGAPLRLVAGTQYAIVVRALAAGVDVGLWTLPDPAFPPVPDYESGNCSVSTDSGATWAALLYDYFFREIGYSSV